MSVAGQHGMLPDRVRGCVRCRRRTCLVGGRRLRLVCGVCAHLLIRTTLPQRAADFGKATTRDERRRTAGIPSAYPRWCVDSLYTEYIAPSECKAHHAKAPFADRD